MALDGRTALNDLALYQDAANMIAWTLCLVSNFEPSRTGSGWAQTRREQALSLGALVPRPFLGVLENYFSE